MRAARAAGKLTRGRLSNCRPAATPCVEPYGKSWPFRVRRCARYRDVTGPAGIVLSGLYAFYRERIRHREVAASATGRPGCDEDLQVPTSTGSGAHDRQHSL